MKIKFDNVEINGNYVMSLSQEGKLFTDTFKLGSTVCRIMDLQISKESNVDTAPNVVTIFDDNNNQIFKGYVDELSENNVKYYNFSLADSMIKLNVSLAEIFDWTVDVDYTVQDIVDKICDYIDSSDVTVDYIDDLVMTWDYDISARDFLGYVAEVMGCFVRINGSGNIQMVSMKSQSKQTINFNTCKDISIGEQHTISRVAFNSGTASYFYPNQEVEGNTLYVNPENVLLTDTGDYSIEDTIEHIYEEINGFNFYPIVSSRCQIDESILPGDIVTFSDGTNSYPTIAQIEWNYVGGWKGGYNLEISTEIQEETQVTKLIDRIKSIKIKVDRELNQILQRVEDTEASIEIIAGGVIRNVDVMYGQSAITLPPTEPTVWTTLAPQWDNSKQMWEKTRINYADSSIEDTEATQISKEGNKSVYSITELYYCSDSEEIPAIPTSHISSTANVYGQWTKQCPETNTRYTIYFTCSEINYLDGSYSWTDPKYVGGYLSNEAINNKVKETVREVSNVNQKANSLEVSVQEIKETTIPDLEARTEILETCVSIQTEGVRISQGTLGAYTLLTDEGMEIYAEGNKVAYALKDGFYATDYIMNGWHMITANDKNSFCFIRKEYN